MSEDDPYNTSPCMTLEKRISDRFEQLQKDKDDVSVLKQQIERMEQSSRQCADLKEKLYRIESGEEEVEFLLDIFPILQKYEIVESSPTPPPPTETGPGKISGMLSFVKIEARHNRGQLMREYMRDVEKVHFRADRDENGAQHVCGACRVPLLVVDRESTVVCPTCGRTEATFNHSMSILSYEDQISRDHSNYYAYKRINHFSEWLSSVQAKENTEIPGDVLEALRFEYKKIRILKASQITTTKTREFLKKLKLTKYYEHVHYITNLLNNIPAHNIPSALETKLRHMFQEIQGPWERTKPKNRSNFFSYSFVLHKFCELLGADEYLPLFPLLKSAEKLYQQDQMWKAVCRELGWEFHASV